VKPISERRKMVFGRNWPQRLQQSKLWWVRGVGWELELACGSLVERCGVVGGG
jgi:hypothetical protein